MTWVVFLSVGLAGTTMLVIFGWPFSALLLTASLSLLTAWEWPDWPALVTVAGSSIYPLDLAMLAMITDALFRGRRSLIYSRPLAIACTALVGILILNLMRTVSIDSGINEFRSFFYFFVPILWGVCSPSAIRQLPNRVSRWMCWTGWALSAVAAYHALRFGIGQADSLIFRSDGPATTGRVLVSSQSLALATAAIVAFHQWRLAGRRRDFLSGCAFSLVVVMAQHRSVWVALIAGLLVSFPLLRPTTRLQLVSATFGLILSLVLALRFGLRWSAMPMLDHSATSSATYDARQSDWISLVSSTRDSGPLTIAFGFPFGHGWERIVRGFAITYSPHNWYVSIYLRAGLLGLTAYLLMTWRLLAQALSRKDAMIVGLIACCAAYSWTYSLPWQITPVVLWCLIGTASLQAEPNSPGAYSNNTVSNPAAQGPRESMSRSALSRG